MIDLALLRRFGTTNERLRELFTALPDPNMPEQDPMAVRNARDITEREKMENWCLHTLQEHMSFALKNYKFYAAADLAWDSVAITKQTVPLLMYAQGKISIENVVESLKDLKGSDHFVKKGDNGVVVGLELPKLYESSVNLVRSIITRRMAAQVNKYNNLFPFYEYNPRGTGLVSKLRADVLSQVVDIMADNYGYRHQDEQVLRDMFLYGHCVNFVAQGWNVEKQWRVKKVDAEMAPTDEKNADIEAYVEKEGVIFDNPHPSRTFWDNAHPLASLNSDTGCEFIGFWDAYRYRDVKDNVAYFNRDKIPYQRSAGLWGLYFAYPAYFNQYLTQINPPFPRPSDPASENDRLANIGVYEGSVEGSSIFVADIRRKVIPKNIGCGDYPWPVWLRMKVASDKTIIFAEWLPSSPAAYCGYNENDARQLNVAMSHNLMAYQDQLSNLQTALLMAIKSENLRIYAINIDAVPDRGNVDAIRHQLQGTIWTGTPLVVEYSKSKSMEMGIDPKDVVTLCETRKTDNTIEVIIKAILQLMSMIERLEAMSPQEQGQPAPREISATEVNSIENTTNTVYSFISNSIDEYRASKKRIIYESLVSCGQDDFMAPVTSRYTKETVEKAGFKPVADETEDFQGDAKRHTVMGNKKDLRCNYVFTSRDGAQRPVNTQAANTLVQLLAQIMNVPSILQAMGKSKLYEIVNDIFRMSGAGVDLNLELKEGESDDLGQDQVKQLTQAVQQLAQHVQQDATDIAGFKKMLPELMQAVKTDAANVKKLQGQIQTREDIDIKIPYDKCPPDVQRQLELKAGLTPSQMSTQPNLPPNAIPLPPQ